MNVTRGPIRKKRDGVVIEKSEASANIYCKSLPRAIMCYAEIDYTSSNKSRHDKSPHDWDQLT